MDIDVFLGLSALFFFIAIIYCSKRENFEPHIFFTQKIISADVFFGAHKRANTARERIENIEDVAAYILLEKAFAVQPMLVNTTAEIGCNEVNAEQFYDHAEFGVASFGKTSLSFRASRYSNSSHRHADLGNLALIDNGLGVLIPTGSYGYCFDSEQDNSLTNKTQAHNLPLIGGRGQLMSNKSAIAGIVYQQEGPGWCCKKIDLSKAYQGVNSFIRTFILIEDKGLVVWDSVQLWTEKTLQWRLHSHLEAQLKPECIRLQGDNVQYECSIVNNKEVQATVEHDCQGNTAGVDAIDDVCHLQWEFPKNKEHNVVVSCLKSPLDINLNEEGITIQLAQCSIVVNSLSADGFISAS